MTGQRRAKLPGLVLVAAILQDDGLVVAGGGQGAPAWGKRHCFHRAGMADEGFTKSSRPFPVCDIPQKTVPSTLAVARVRPSGAKATPNTRACQLRMVESSYYGRMPPQMAENLL